MALAGTLALGPIRVQIRPNEPLVPNNLLARRGCLEGATASGAASSSGSLL